MSRRQWLDRLEHPARNPRRMPLGTSYAQALAMWRHRLDRRREANLAAVEAVHDAVVRARRAGSAEGAPGAAPAPAEREEAGPGVPGRDARCSLIGCWDLL